MIKRIELQLFDLETDRIVQAVAHYIDLGEHTCTYHVECYVEKQPDKDNEEYEPKDEYIFYHGLILRKAITAIDIDFAPAKDDKYDTWVVEVNAVGMDTHIRIKCETRGKAETLHAQLAEWWLL